MNIYFNLFDGTRFRTKAFAEVKMDLGLKIWNGVELLHTAEKFTLFKIGKAHFIGSFLFIALNSDLKHLQKLVWN